jgi:N-acyl-D-amino-acid deacylase
MNMKISMLRSRLFRSFAIVLSAIVSIADASPTGYLITNARIVDGSGKPSIVGDVRVKGDMIAAIGELTARAGETVVDGHDLVLAPGFIDMHSHHDDLILQKPDVTAATSQGITTIVVGVDGDSRLPLTAFFKQLSVKGSAVNVASYVGHGSVRAAVMGDDFRRTATPQEIGRMQSLVRREMKAGAFGLSTGLEYDPAIYAAYDEVLALARTAQTYDGTYKSHIRSEDVRLDDAIDEIIRLGRDTGMKVNIDHLKIARVDYWGRAPAILQRLDKARSEGVRITADVYPYTYWQSTMTVLFPKRDFDNRASAEFALTKLVRPDGLIFTLFKPDPTIVGKSLQEVASIRNKDPVTAYMALIAQAKAYQVRTKDTGFIEAVLGFSMREDDVDTFIEWPHSMISSDGASAGGHPRAAGAFTRVLRRFGREKNQPIETVIYKMTGASAAFLGLSDRGLIAVGKKADLVLFDFKTVTDTADVKQPLSPSNGITDVWVNGERVQINGQSTKALPGRALVRHARH